MARELRMALAKGTSEEKAKVSNDDIDAEAYICQHGQGSGQ